MPRYNIALVPKHNEKFIECAEHFRDHDGIDYLLSEHSLPHITLVQFRTDNSNEISQLCQLVQNKLSPFKTKDLPLILKGLNFFKDSKRENFIWLQLTPNQSDLLHALHREMVNCLQELAIVPINRALDEYEPHLTLVHTPNLSYLEKACEYVIELEDTFSISLGESDEIGQLINVKFHFTS